MKSEDCYIIERECNGSVKINETKKWHNYEHKYGHPLSHFETLKPSVKITLKKIIRSHQSNIVHKAKRKTAREKNQNYQTNRKCQ